LRASTSDPAPIDRQARSPSRDGGRLDRKEGRSDRGRAAGKPQDIPPAGWWDITWRVFHRLGSDNITLVSEGVAMYLLLSVFPALAAAVSLYGLFATPADVVKHMDVFAGVLPPGVWQIFSSQLQVLAGHAQSSLSIGAALGLVLALWSARSAMSAFMTATNIAYGESARARCLQSTFAPLRITARPTVRRAAESHYSCGSTFPASSW
jgi:membrane protein